MLKYSLKCRRRISIDFFARKVIHRVRLDADKFKEPRISFAKEPTDFDPLTVSGKELEVVDSVKLLSVTISSSLSWNTIAVVIKKATTSCKIVETVAIKNISSF